MVRKSLSVTDVQIADALIKLRLPHGGHLPGIEMYSPAYVDGPTRICGPAFTVRVRDWPKLGTSS